MDRKLSVVANVRYQSSKGGGGGRSLKGLLRYFQYRDDRDGHIKQEQGLERWVDKGLGRNFQNVAANCDALRSEHVQAFLFVINPNPDLIRLVPDERREVFVKDLTEQTVEAFFEARNVEGIEYSYAYHNRVTDDTEAPGRDNPHTHVVLPGTYDSFADGERLPLYMNRSKRENHIDMLHKVAQEKIDLLLQREVGLDWEQRYDAWAMAQEVERERALAETLTREGFDVDADFKLPEIIPEAVAKLDRWFGMKEKPVAGPSLDIS